MKGGPTTMRDIAIKLGISVSTVSRAFRDVGDINPETKKAVLELAEQLNYKPNPFASNLVKNRSNLIGVVVPHVEESFFARVISGIQSVTFNSEFNVIITNVGRTVSREQKDVENLILSRVDAIVMAPFAGDKVDYTHLEKVIDRKIPLVFFDRVADNIPASKVIVDDFTGAFNAVEYLIQTGCETIFHLAGHDTLSLAKERKEGYKAALAKYQLNYSEEMSPFSGYDYGDGVNIARKLISEGKTPDAIFGVSDRVTIGAMNEFIRLGYKVPEEISFIGFTNEPVTEMVTPRLTTVEQKAHIIGEEAGKIAIELIRNMRNKKALINKTIIIDTELIIRESTR